LYLSGKMLSERHRFTMVVIGRIRAGRQDFKSEVGMGSREQEGPQLGDVQENWNDSRHVNLEFCM